ncbi:DNA methyltransferase [Podophage Lau218]|uniref:Putative phage protein n=2 Tax=Lauvirus lau218 TaxID=1465639 RepID=A0A060BGU7_9CAUD|nr:DNA methyltransferase [Podophage Lau218]AIA83135.1 putative phage protein [Podophage Lau218]AIA83232.1 putative phage protein [Lauvirus lau218]
MKTGILKTKNNNSKNPASDEYYTPPEGIEPLVKFLNKELRYYEPTAGKSQRIVKYLTSKGFNITGSKPDEDFLKGDFSDYDAIITNPPFSNKGDFIERCYEIGKPFALLMPVSTIQGQKRGKRFIEDGIELLVLNKRVSFIKPDNTIAGSPSFGVAWFCHGILPEKLQFHEARK